MSLPSPSPKSSPLLNTARRHATQLAYAEHLLFSLPFPLPIATAQLATQRGLDLSALSRAYGQRIAASVLENVPVGLDEARFLTAFAEAANGCGGAGDVPPLLLETWLGETRAAAEEKRDMEEGWDHMYPAMSDMYGRILGRNVRLSGMEWDVDVVLESTTQWLQGVRKEEMGADQYATQFGTLMDCASEALGAGKIDAADKFFLEMKKMDGVIDVQGDGYVLGVWGKGRGEGNEVTLDSHVKLGLRVRLLEGRALLVPKFGEDGGEFDGALDMLPMALVCVIQGMRKGEVRSAFFHPYAAHEVLELVAAVGEASQAGAVVDVFLMDIVKK